MLKVIAFLVLALSLGACATRQPDAAGFLTGYEGLETKSKLRAAVRERADQAALAQVRTVAMTPTVFAPTGDASWLTDEQRAMLLREVDAQICFELTETFELAPLGQADAHVRTAITAVKSTGRAGSMMAAAAGFFIPGPIGLRPGKSGGLTVESELLDRADRQIAALTWSRKANVIGTDNPSLSRIGDAMQFAEPLGDEIGRTFRPEGAKKREISAENDPCKAYGPRFRVAGMATKLATGLYVPQLDSAKASASNQAPAAAAAEAGADAATRPTRR